MAVRFHVIPQRERRVGYPQLPHHRAGPEPGQGRRRPSTHADQLERRGNHVSIEWRRVGGVLALVEVEREVEDTSRGAVAAAELVLVERGREGGGRSVVVVVVEHEIMYRGLAGDLATFHHHGEIG